MKTLVAGLIACLASLSAIADCTVPAPVAELPRGATASRAEMVAAMGVIKAYDAAVNQYLSCLKQNGQSGAIGDRYEVTLTNLNRVAEQFNGELRIFKGRNGT